MGRKKRVRMESLAEELGVSVVTVSNALNGRKGVSDETRHKILPLAEQLGYNKPDVEQAHSQKEYMIGCIVASCFVQDAPSFYLALYQSIAAEAERRSYMTVLEIITPEMEMPSRSLSVFQGMSVDGILVIGEFSHRYLEHLTEQYCNIPVACVDHYDVLENIDYILTDSFHGMEQMTRLLLDQGLTDLQFVGTVGATNSITDRYLGFCKALARRGIQPDLRPMIPDREGNQLITPVLPDSLPQGFVCNCDRTAFTVISLLHARGIRVPEDVSVVGFDHFPRGRSDQIRLATYRNDETVIAQLCLHVLSNRMDGIASPDRIRMVEGSMIHGTSVKYKKRGRNG